MNTVLFLNDTLAVWICFVKQTAVNVHVETFNSESADYEPCSWLKNKRADITLVVDTVRCEIDAHPLIRVGSTLTNTSNTKALKKRLKLQFPEATIASLSGKAKNTNVKSDGAQRDAVLVQHLHLSDQHKQWLAKVEKCDLTICSVVSSPDVFADVLSSCNGHYIIVSNVLGSCKHVFCLNGQALFVRNFEHANLDTFYDDLQETVAHLQSVELLSSSIPAYTIGFPDEVSKEARLIDGIGSIQCFETSAEYKKSRVALVDESLSQYRSVIQLAKHAHSHYSRTKWLGHRGGSTLLSKYHESQGRRRRHMQVAGLSALCVLSIVYTATLKQQYDQKNRFFQDKASNLNQNIEALHAEIEQQSPIGLALSHAFLTALSLQDSMSIGPGRLLAVLSDVLSAHRSLVLDELTWVSFAADSNKVVNRSAKQSTVPQIGSDRYQADAQLLGRTEFRNTVPESHLTKDMVLVSLAGRSRSHDGLREQQDAVNGLISELQQVSLVSDIALVESPLQMTADNGSSQAENRSTGFRVNFRVLR